MKSWTISMNVFRRIMRDPRTLILVILTPLFFILLYGISFSSTATNVKLIVINKDNGIASVKTQRADRIQESLALGEQLVQNLDSSIFEVELLSSSEGVAVAREQVERGEAWAALILPTYFTHGFVNEALRKLGPRTIQEGGQNITVIPDTENESPILVDLILDDSNPLIAASIAPAITRAFDSILISFLPNTSVGSISATQNSINVQPIYNGAIDRLDYTAPGVIGFAIMLISIMLTSISIVRERTSGTLTRLLIAPVRPWEVSVGYVVAFLLIALVQAAELLLVSYYLFDIRFAGSPLWVALIVLLFSIGLQGVATLISTLARNEFQAMQFILVILIPSIMLAGVFWPIETMPMEIQPVALLNPLTHANSALRDVMLRGWEFSDISTQVAVLAGFALLMLVLSVQSMRHQAHSG